MSELQSTHPMFRDHAPTLQNELWLHFINEFTRWDSTPMNSRQRAERHVAREALSRTRNPAYNGRKIHTEFKTLYGERAGFLEKTRQREATPFFAYFDACRQKNNLAVHRRKIYQNYIRLLNDLSDRYKQQARLPDFGSRKKSPRKRWRGRAAEMVCGALIARLQHPNILLVPSLAIQDSYGMVGDNHDYLYIDTSSDIPIVLPTQVKSLSFHLARNEYKYDTDIAAVFGDLDLHTCPYVRPQCNEKTISDCLIKRTVPMLINEDSHADSEILDTLSNGLLIKLSTWEDNNWNWHESMRERRAQILAQQALKGRKAKK